MLTAHVRIDVRSAQIDAENATLYQAYEVTQLTVFLIRSNGHIGYRRVPSEPERNS